MSQIEHFKKSSWCYSQDHGQISQVIESQALWGKTTCRAWLPDQDSIVYLPASQLIHLEETNIGTSDYIEYITSTTSVADFLTQRLLPQVRNYRLNQLSIEEKAWHQNLENQTQVMPEMVPLILIQIAENENGKLAR